MIYATTDLYIAAALILTSGEQPDRIEVQHGDICAVIWNDDLKLSAQISKLETGALLVDPKKFRNIHIELKKRVLSVIDQRKEKDK